MARMKFMNTEIDNLTMEEALERIDDLIGQNRNAYVVTPNVDHIVQLEKGSELREVYRYADLILTDGKPLVWISKWYKTPIKEKIFMIGVTQSLRVPRGTPSPPAFGEACHPHSR